MNRQLSPEELDHYHEHGYVLVENFISPEEIANINDAIDAFYTEKANTGKGEQHGLHAFMDDGSIFQLGLTTPRLAAMCEDDRVLDLIEPLVNPGISIYSAKLVNKAPHSAKKCLWHQDDAYYAQNSDSQCRMSIWLPLQDVTLAHGALQVIPGSHRDGLQPASLKKGKGHCNLALDVEVDLSKRHYVPMKAGSVLLFSALLWHGSDGNNTDENRRAFIVSYQEGTVTAGNGPQYKLLRSPQVSSV